MNFLWIPYYEEKIKVKISAEELTLLLLKATSAESDSTPVFQGKISSHSFVIHEKLNRPNNFIPIIKGEIENREVRISYGLFPVTKIFIIFWSVLLLITASVCFIITDEMLYGFFALGIMLVDYLIVIFNFNSQVKRSKKLFLEILKTNV